MEEEREREKWKEGGSKRERYGEEERGEKREEEEGRKIDVSLACYGGMPSRC